MKKSIEVLRFGGNKGVNLRPINLKHSYERRRKCM